ncbi:MAG: sporulation protein YunB [Clostridiales bacterium]|nr:sporulation protein YunB [Clostridiales bacterium]
MKKISFFPILLIVSCFLISILFFADREIFPAALDLGKSQFHQEAAAAIDQAVLEGMAAKNLKSSDLYHVSSHASIVTVAADAVMINTLMSEINGIMIDKLKQLEKREILVPLGTASGIGIFQNCGPNIAFSMLPASDNTIDYETSFSSAGINQIYFRIWLKVRIKTGLINALEREEIVIERKIMIVETVIQGDIPDMLWPLGEKNSGSVIEE